MIATGSLNLDGLGCEKPQYMQRAKGIAGEFIKRYGEADGALFISSPGRVEVGGNHTDHQNGCVLAAAINRDALGVCAPNGRNEIRVTSAGYAECIVSLDDLSIAERDRGKTIALVRGIADRFRQRGAELRGFDAYVESNVLEGSGLSSSASFEVWLATAINALCCNEAVGSIELAQIGQYAENVHFGKPCGLMDQTSIAVGGFVFIDFYDKQNPVVQPINAAVDGHALCVIDSGADHANLTDAYASITQEMGAVAAYFGEEVLSRVDQQMLLDNLHDVRAALGDRAVIRALHFYAENKRALRQAQALREGNTEQFLSLVNESGRSSYMYVQNVTMPGAVREQPMALTLQLCGEIPGGRGAYRVHGGGFAGTVLAFVPDDMVEVFCKQMHALLGENKCHLLQVRMAGATRL